ncbi:MAG: CDC27 family protein [bacterium]
MTDIEKLQSLYGQKQYAQVLDLVSQVLEDDNEQLQVHVLAANSALQLKKWATAATHLEFCSIKTRARRRYATI